MGHFTIFDILYDLNVLSQTVGLFYISNGSVLSQAGLYCPEWVHTAPDGSVLPPMGLHCIKCQVYYLFICTVKAGPVLSVSSGSAVVSDLGLFRLAWVCTISSSSFLFLGGFSRSQA